MSKARDIASAAPAPSTVSATELGYLDGVSSAIQTQIDGKASTTADIPKSLIDAKGDLIVGSAADTAARLAVGTNDYVLTADSSATNGIKWAAASSGGGLTLLSTTTISGAGTITVSSISQSYKNLFIYGKDIKHTGSPNENIYLRLNGDTGSNYQDNYFVILTSAADPDRGVNTANKAVLTGLTADDSWNLYNRFLLNIYRYTETENKMIMCEGRTIRSGQSERWFNNIAFNSTSAITSISLISGTTNFGGGTLYIYGVS